MPPRTKTTSISLDPKLVARAKARAAERGFQFSFSAYIAALITDDLKSGESDNPNQKGVQYSRKITQEIDN